MKFFCNVFFITLISISLLSFAQSKTTVFVVPHSHNDAGWLINIDECYERYCKPTLSNIFKLMETQKSLKFCWSEVLFLSMWLSEFPEQKKKLRDYISQGRFEIVGGGWVQNDDSLPDFELVARQMQEGFDYLKKELGLSRIRIGWQLDPFGHSSLTAALFEKMGFEVLVFARAGDTIQNYLSLEGNYEFIWKAEGFATEGIFTHILNNHYGFPTFARYNDWYQGPIPKCFTFLPAYESDVENCAKNLKQYVEFSQGKYRTSNHLLLLGDDFAFTDFEKSQAYFQLWEGMMNMSEGIEVKFATPSEYFEAVFKEKRNFPVYEGDFLPLIVGPNNELFGFNRVWSGFYNTKPFLKKGILDLQKKVRIAEFFSAVYLKEPISTLELAALTHHDAITGTCKFAVYVDYLRRLSKENKKIMESLKNSFLSIFNFKVTGKELMVPIKVVILVNPVNWRVKKVMSHLANTPFVRILDSYGQSVYSEGIQGPETNEFFFEAELNSMQCRVFFIEESLSSCENCSENMTFSNNSEISNDFFTITMKNGLIESFTKNKKVLTVNQKLINYPTFFSGAYIFTPFGEGSEIKILETYSVYQGKLLSVIKSSFKFRDQVLNQELKVYPSDYFELSFDLNASFDSDILMSFSNNYKEKGWFYTFNTADVTRRYFIPEDFITKGSNYYPINGGLLVDLDECFLSIFPSFPTGAGMPKADTFEIHLHRHPSQDDGMGLGSYVEDIFPVKHNWRVTLGDFSLSKTWKDFLSHKASPLLFYLKNQNFYITTDSKEAFQFSEMIQADTHYSIVPHSSCKYLSSLALKDKDLVLNVLNICEKDEEMAWLRLFDEVSFSWLESHPSPKVQLIKENVFNFRWRNNSGENVIKHPKIKNSSKFGPFELRTFTGSHKKLSEMNKDNNLD